MSFDLIYITDQKKGITRIKKDDNFSYYDCNGNLIQDQKEVERLNKLAIPPIWEDVWVCDNPKGHLQAVGYDQKGRKQYLYHDEWMSFRNENKYHKIYEFGKTLPDIRKKAYEDIQKSGWPREKVLGLVILTLDELHIRIGNLHYKKVNETYGLTTLRRRHLHLQDDTIRLEYKAKSGKYRKINVKNNHLVNLIREVSELPGYEIFRYKEKGKTIPVDSQDVNEYLKEISNESFSSKDFRTWGGTVKAIEKIPEAIAAVKDNKRLKLSSTVVKLVANDLGNTQSICRDYYIHPIVMNKVENEELDSFEFENFDSGKFGHEPAEKKALALIEEYESNINKY
jgi:DNA topoisomerase I